MCKNAQSEQKITLPNKVLIEQEQGQTNHISFLLINAGQL